MVFGGVAEERIQLNEGTIWSGIPEDLDRAGAFRHFPAIRKLLYEGEYKEADKLVKKEVLGRRPLGCYQPLGDLMLQFQGLEKPAGDFCELPSTRAESSASIQGAEQSVPSIPFRRAPVASFAHCRYHSPPS